MLDLERLERLLEYDSEKSKLRPPGPNLLSPSSPKAHSVAAAAAGSGGRRSLHETYSAGGSAASSLGSSLANSRAPSPAMGSRTCRGSAAGAGHLLAAGSTGGAGTAAEGAARAAAADGRQPQSRRQTPDADVQSHAVHNRQMYCGECAGIIEDMCPFTPGAGAVTASPPSWSQWQQQRHRGNSPLGLAGSDNGSQQRQQQQQAEPDRLTPSPFQLQQEHSTPSVGCTARCEVCGKRLRLSTPDGLLPDSSQASMAAAQSNTAAAGAGAGGTAAEAERGSRPAQTSIVSAIAGVLPASITAALQSVGSSGGGQTIPAVQAASQQQAQQFDAVAAAAADFDAAGSQSFLLQPSDQWTRWQGVVSAVRGAHSSQQQLSHGGGSSTSLLEAGEACSTPGREVRFFLRLITNTCSLSAPKHDTLALQTPRLPAYTNSKSEGCWLHHLLVTELGTVCVGCVLPQTSMVQRMWETWAPKALDGASSAEAGNTGGSARLSAGLGLFKRPSRASSNLAEQQQLSSARISRNSSPATEGAGPMQQFDVQEQLGEQQQPAGQSIQQAGAAHGHSSHGPSRLRPDAEHSTAGAAAAAEISGMSAAHAADARSWQADPNLRPLRSYKGNSQGAPVIQLTGPDGLRDISTTSNASFYSVDDEPNSSSTADEPAGQRPVSGHDKQQQQQEQKVEQLIQQQQAAGSKSLAALQQQAQQQQGLRQRGRSEVLMRQPSPPPGQLPAVQLVGGRRQRWSDPASWPSRPRTPSPLPTLSTTARASHGGQQAGDSARGSDSIVSAFAAIAAAAEPFDGSIPHLGTQPSTNSSLNAGELLSNSSVGSELDAAAAAVVSAPVDAVAVDSWDSSSQGGAARVNVTIGGGLIPSADSKLQVQLQPLVMQPPSRTGSGRRSALFEEVALRRWVAGGCFCVIAQACCPSAAAVPASTSGVVSAPCIPDKD